MYDYVIVGAGSAGCVLANRLTEDPDVSVLLLEAGGPDTNELVHLPAAFSALYRTAQDWDHSTIYEPFANDRRIYLPRGKVLGGSSSINAMIYIRGNPLDYDEWGPGWTWAEMLPYFKRSEDNERGESDLHGAGGPLPVSDGRSLNPLAQGFVDAALSQGHPANDDFNGPAQDGVGLYQLTQRGGARASAAVAYLPPVMDRPNLTVETHVQALSLVFEGERAVGVLRARLSEPLEFRAEREVIVRGRGPRAPHLECRGGGRLRTHARRPAGAGRAVPFHACPLPVRGPRAGRRPRVLGGRLRAEAEEPRLRGARLPGPHRQAAHRPQLPGAPGRRGVDGRRVRMAMEICATEPLAGYSPELLMGPESLSDEDIIEKSRAHMQTLYHPVGTCAIDAVVDRELRVLGIEGLRVVDASAMPSVPRGNTNAPVIALAERASDLIRGRAPLKAEAAATPA